MSGSHRGGGGGEGGRGGGVHEPFFEQNFFSCVSVLSVSSILVFSVSAPFSQFYFPFVANPPLFPETPRPLDFNFMDMYPVFLMEYKGYEHFGS